MNVNGSEVILRTLSVFIEAVTGQLCLLVIWDCLLTNTILWVLLLCDETFLSRNVSLVFTWIVTSGLGFEKCKNLQRPTETTLNGPLKIIRNNRIDSEMKIDLNFCAMFTLWFMYLFHDYSKKCNKLTLHIYLF